MRLTVLGTGTSHGIPMIGCRCPVCTSDDPRNRRMRTSCTVEMGEGRLLIDTTPELRIQATRFGVDRVDAVALTHAHADHIMGLDDLRRFAELGRAPVPVHASPPTLARVRQVFSYALTDDGLPLYGIPIVEWNVWTEPIDLWGHRVTPVTVEHGLEPATGVRIDAPGGGSLAWCPDCVGLGEEAGERLAGLDVLFLDGLRHNPHPTHFTVAQSVATIERLAPKRAWLIHMTHDLDHAATEAALPDGIALAWDGQVVEV